MGGLRVWILCVAGRSRYLCIMHGRIPAHLRCTQCSILFHLMDIGPQLLGAGWFDTNCTAA